MSDYSAHLQFIVGLFAMMDPIGTIPIMLGLTASFTGRQYRQVAMTATLAVMIILVGAQYSGVWLLDLLGTSLGSLEIAGGLVIGFTGFMMLSASGVESNPMFGGDKDSPAWQMGIVPLAILLLAGPGAITKVLLESQDAHGVDDAFHVTLVIVGVSLAVGVILMVGQLVGKLIGKVGTIIFNRLFGLIVIAIGVEILISGISQHMVKLAN